MALVGNIESYRGDHKPQRLTKRLYMIPYESISKHRVVDLTLNQSQTLVSPIFRSCLVPSVAAGVSEKCFRGQIYNLEDGPKKTIASRNLGCLETVPITFPEL